MLADSFDLNGFHFAIVASPLVCAHTVAVRADSAVFTATSALKTIASCYFDIGAEALNACICLPLEFEEAGVAG